MELPIRDITLRILLLRVVSSCDMGLRSAEVAENMFGTWKALSLVEAQNLRCLMMTPSGIISARRRSRRVENSRYCSCGVGVGGRFIGRKWRGRRLL